MKSHIRSLDRFLDKVDLFIESPSGSKPNVFNEKKATLYISELEVEADHYLNIYNQRDIEDPNCSKRKALSKAKELDERAKVLRNRIIVCEILDEDSEVWAEMLSRLLDQLAIKFHRDTGMLIGTYLTGGEAGKLTAEEKAELELHDREMDKLRDLDHVLDALNHAVGGSE